MHPFRSPAALLLSHSGVASAAGHGLPRHQQEVRQAVLQQGQGPGRAVLGEARGLQLRPLRRRLPQAPAGRGGQGLRRRHQVQHHVRPGHVQLRCLAHPPDLQQRRREPAEEGRDQARVRRQERVHPPVHAAPQAGQLGRGLLRPEEQVERQALRRLGLSGGDDPRSGRSPPGAGPGGEGARGLERGGRRRVRGAARRQPEPEDDPQSRVRR